MQRDNKKSTSLPQTLTLTANLSAGLNIAVCLTYFILSIIAIVVRFHCSAGDPENVSGSQYFWNTIYRVYFQDEDCVSSLSMAQLTSSYTVFVLMTLTLCVAVLGFIVAIALIWVIQNEGPAQYINLVVYGHIGICFATLVIDLTLASHFGIDYSFLGEQLSASSSGLDFNYERDVIRQGAFLLMAFTLKCYVFHVINIVVLILLVMYLIEYQNAIKKDDHSIHKVGALSAYDNHRRQEDWPQHVDATSPFARGNPHVNSVFVEDEPMRPPQREPPRSDYYNMPNSNRSFDRSDSWHRSHPHPNQAARPFSYLEDTRRAAPVKPPSSPAMDPNWRRDPWPQAPPVPAPDYSPQTPRRLKSALKPAYM